MRTTVLALCLAAGLAATAPSTYAAGASFELYNIHDLGSLGGARGAGATSLNGLGTSVGYSFVHGTNLVHAMANVRGEVLDLGTLGGPQSLARAVSADGTVVGWAYGPNSFFPEAFRWVDGVMSPLGNFGYPRSDARAINSDGVIVGSAYASLNVEHAFWWRDGVMHDMGTLGGSVSRANDVNLRGVVCGMSSLQTPIEDVHAFLAKVGEPMIDLGTLGGEAAHALAINELDHVVGWSYVSRTAPESRAFIFRGGRLVALADLGGASAAAYALNDADVIVGDATYPDGRQVAVIWKGDEIRDLNTLILDGSGWVLTRAVDVTESGVIVGEGLRLGVPAAFILVPAQLTSVPVVEPAGFAFAAPQPNPARSGCRFAWHLPSADALRLELYDVRGRRVRVLHEGAAEAGAGSLRWDGRDSAGRPVANGLYWARLSTRGHTLSQRVVVAR